MAEESVGSNALVPGAVTTVKVADNAINAAKLNVSGNGTSGYLLASDADGSFSWVAPSTGDITGVTAGTGLSGGGSSGSVTLATDFSELSALNSAKWR